MEYCDARGKVALSDEARSDCGVAADGFYRTQARELEVRVDACMARPRSLLEVGWGSGERRRGVGAYSTGLPSVRALRADSSRREFSCISAEQEVIRS